MTGRGSRLSEPSDPGQLCSPPPGGPPAAQGRAAELWEVPLWENSVGAVRADVKHMGARPVRLSSCGAVWRGRQTLEMWRHELSGPKAGALSGL